MEHNPKPTLEIKMRLEVICCLVVLWTCSAFVSEENSTDEVQCKH